MKKLLAAVGLVGAAGLAFACSVDATGTGEDEFVGESQEAISQWACTDKNGIIQNLKYQYEAALAIAALNEMRDLEADLNFRLQNGTWGKLELTQTGLDKCAANGRAGCPSTSSILQLQSMTATQAMIPGWSPGNFSNILESHHKRYKDVAAWDYTGCGGANDVPIRMTVTPDGTSNDGVCAQYGVQDSVNYWYKSSVPGKLWCKFTAFGGSYGTNGSGDPENPFMKYVSSNGREGVDPVGGDMYGNPVPTQPGQACGNTAPLMGSFPYTSPYGNVVYQSTWINQCCYVNGKSGTYQKHPYWQNTQVYCKTA